MLVILTQNLKYDDYISYELEDKKVKSPNYNEGHSDLYLY